VVRPRDLAMDGTAPTIIYGYGGFQVSKPPAYIPEMGKLWLENGGVYVIANIRGGGEFGPAWHQAVLKEKGYDDVQKFVDKTLFQSPVPSELKQKMIAEFEKIKAGY
jgi:prolyl oligopeptidase PreP (S9A serine peptidase family)